MIDGSGQSVALMMLMAVLEKAAIARGDPSLMDQIHALLRGQNEGNVSDLSLAREGTSPSTWRQDAIEMVLFAKHASTQVDQRV